MSTEQAAVLSVEQSCLDLPTGQSGLQVSLVQSLLFEGRNLDSVPELFFFLIHLGILIRSQLSDDPVVPLCPMVYSWETDTIVRLEPWSLFLLASPPSVGQATSWLEASRKKSQHPLQASLETSQQFLPPTGKG